MAVYKAGGWSAQRSISGTSSTSLIMNMTDNDHRGIVRIDANIIPSASTGVYMSFYNNTTGSGTPLTVKYQSWPDGTTGGFTNGGSTNMQLTYWNLAGSTTSAKQSLDAQIWVDNTKQKRSQGRTIVNCQIAYRPSFNIYLQLGVSCQVDTGGSSSTSLGSIRFGVYSGTMNAKISLHPCMARYL